MAIVGFGRSYVVNHIKFRKPIVASAVMWRWDAVFAQGDTLTVLDAT
jgi:hypothetical protein